MHPDIPEELDEVQFGTHLTGKFLDSERTVFRGIHRVLPGHLLTVSPQGLTTRSYWEPRPTDRPLPTTDAGCAEEFLDLFREAVQCRLRSAFPVGSELSGGLDSSLVTCVARDLRTASSPLSTISLVYDRFPESDERTYIEEVVAQGGIKAHYVPVEREGLLALLDQIYSYLDDGRASGNHHLNWLTAAGGHRAGVRVLLTGRDGDTMVYHGWQRFNELARDGQWERFAHEAIRCVQKINRERGTYAMQETFRSPLDVLNAYAGSHLQQWAQERRYLRLFRATEQIHQHFGVARREMYRRLWRDMVRPPVSESQQMEVLKRRAKGMVPRVLSSELVDRIELEDRLADHLAQDERGGTVREAQLRTLTSPQLHYSFEKFEQYAAAWGVEARHPFMDKRLVEYCLALPSEQSFSDGWSRVVMRRAMQGITPDRIQRRVGKTSLAAPYRHLLLEHGTDALAETIDGLNDKKDLLNSDHLRTLFERRDRLTPEEVRDLGLGVSMARWLDHRPQLRRTPDLSESAPTSTPMAHTTSPTVP